MPNPLTRFFQTGPDQPRLVADPAEIRRRYEAKRWSIFLSVSFGYCLFYVCRINFSVAKMSMLQDGVLNASKMGVVGSAMLIMYAVGKFVNGFLADRVNVRRFVAAALLGSAAMNLLFGFNALFPVFVILWGLNGWFQSGGSAPCVVALSNWFTFRERGTRYGVWSMSHPAGEWLTFAVTPLVVTAFGWRWGFWGPGLVGAVAALILYKTLADRPPTYGLPPIWEYKGEPVPEKTDAKLGGLQWNAIKHPAVWILGLASASMHVARYGMDHWGPLYLQLVKGYSNTQAGLLMSISPAFALAGTALSGIISDRLFASRRQVVALCYGLIEIGSLVALFLIPPGNAWFDGIALALFGFGIGGLVVLLGGLMAVDLVSRRAAGAAMGLVGILGYIGAATQDTVSGVLIEASKTVVDGKDFYPPEAFDRVFPIWIGTSILALLLVCSVWRAKKRE